MNHFYSILILIVIITQSAYQLKNGTNRRYLPSWPSLDYRATPSWYDDAKIGIFMHFGVFSVPSFGGEWFWHSLTEKSERYTDFMKKNYPEGFKYQDFAHLWKADLFNAAKIVKVAKDAGAKYVIFTTKHHEGFTLWPSKESWNWNSVDIGPKKNIIKMVVDELKKEGIRVILYFSWYEWYNSEYLADKESKYVNHSYVHHFAIPQIMDLINTFQPDGIWADGDWEATSEYWQSKQFLAWLFSDSPVESKVVVNDRFGTDANCHHGSYKNCADRYMPDFPPSFKWEHIMSLDIHSWGNRREAEISHIMTVQEVLATTFKSLSLGGNVVINTGLSSEGTIPLIYQNIYKQVGQFLSQSGEAVYATKPWRVFNETVKENSAVNLNQEVGDVYNQTIWYTASKTSSNIYAMFINWPIDNHLKLTALRVTDKSKITLFGYENPLKYELNPVLDITLPALNEIQYMPAYALKFENFN